MSYDIAKSFRVNFCDFTLKGSFASGNSRPRRFSEYTYTQDLDKYESYESYQKGYLDKEEIFGIEVLAALTSGSIQFYKSVSVRYRYGLLRTFNQIRKDNGNGYCFWEKSQLVKSRDNSIKSEGEYKEEIRKLVGYSNMFYDYVFSKKNERGKFVVELDDGTYLRRMLKYGYRITYYKSLARIYDNKWEAAYDSKRVKGKVVRLRVFSEVY